MIDTLIFSLNAVLPLILLVLIGYLLRKKGLFTDEFLRIANKFCFRFCFFSTMFINIYKIEKFDPVYADLAVFTVISILVLMAIGLVYALIFIKDPRQKGVMIQAFYRSNYAIIGIPLVTMLFGEGNGAVAAIVLACTIPVFNASAVIFLTIFVRAEGQKISLWSIVKKILTNPLIDGILLGLVCQLLRPHFGGWTLEKGEIRFIYRTFESLSKITSPFALIILGGQFRFSATKRLLPQISVAVIARLIFAPLAGLTAAHLCFPHFSAQEFAALVPLFGSPVAVASAIMANQMHNDGELAGQILVWTTLLSGLTIFVTIVILRLLGIL